MPAYPICKKCLVVSGLSEILQEYESFKDLIDHSKVKRLTDHARGFKHGQLAVLDEVTKDIAKLIPYLEIETLKQIRGKGL